MYILYHYNYIMYVSTILCVLAPAGLGGTVDSGKYIQVIEKIDIISFYVVYSIESWDL